MIVKQIPGAELPSDPLWRADLGHRTAYGCSSEEAISNLSVLLPRCKKMNSPYMKDANTFMGNLLILKDKVFGSETTSNTEAAWLAWNSVGYIQNQFLPHQGPVVAYALPSDDLEENCKALLTELTAQQATPANFDWMTAVQLLIALALKYLDSRR